MFRISYFGHVDPEAMAACCLQVEKHLRAMRPGFLVLTDLSGLQAMDVDCVIHLAKIMEHLRASGVRTVVRVIPDPDKDIGFNILSIIHLRRGVKVVTCASKAEAESTLKSHLADQA